jgi:hypothetical protein
VKKLSEKELKMKREMEKIRKLDTQLACMSKMERDMKMKL